MLKKVFGPFFQGINRYGWALIGLGTIAWSATMVKSGLVYSFGMGFWGPNGHDGVWHISLAQGLAHGSLKMLIFSGEKIKNYHIGYDLILAALHKLTLLPIHTLYFQILPPILAILAGSLCYLFILRWTRSTKSAFWATFFVYFGGNWGWVISYLRNHDLAGESMFWSQQSISTLLNPPFALSLFLIFLGLRFLLSGIENENKKSLVISTLLFGILVQIKVYAGALCLGALFISGIWRMLQKKGTSAIKMFTGVISVSVLVLAPLTTNTNNILVFKPFWYLETMMTFSDRLNWPRFGEAMINYQLAGNWIKGIPAYLIAVFIFSVIGGGLVLPLLFIQNGTAWNTIQFMYYSLMFSGILAGISLGNFLEKTKSGVSRFLVGGVVFILTIPTTIGTLRHYLPSRPPAKISLEELQALKFLAKEADGVILTLPFDRIAADAAAGNPPRPLYLYESTAYVSAFTAKPVFMEDEVNLEITGFDWRGRKEKILDFISTPSQEKAKAFLKKEGITYVYWIKEGRGRIDQKQDVLQSIYENSEVQILKTK